MLKYVSLPLLFFFVASALGVFLRWQFISPTPGVNYTFFLHAHSHTMFLGWVFNALYFAFTITHVPESEQRIFQILFLTLQILVVAMMVSFPIQGYGLYSILFSTLHTLLATAFVIIFYKKTKELNSASIWYAHTSLLFFLVSTIGPFFLGYLMSNGLGQSQWYYFSIYYYLHFQYNGFFLFGICSLFFHLLETNQIKFNTLQAKRIGQWMALSCVPAYLLSVLWAKPGLAFNLIAGLAALTQLYALWLLILFIHKHSVQRGFHKSAYPFVVFIFIAFVFKLFLQFLSAHPSIAQFAYEARPVVIAYLHLVLIGVISLFLLIWYMEMNFMSRTVAAKTLILFLIAFAGSEICLILQPWWSTFFKHAAITSSQSIFLFSLILSCCCFLLYYASFKKRT